MSSVVEAEAAHQTVALGSVGVRWGPMGSVGVRWGPSGSDGVRWGPLGSVGVRWGPMGSVGVRWGPLGSDGVRWGPWGPLGSVGPFVHLKIFWPPPEKIPYHFAQIPNDLFLK